MPRAAMRTPARWAVSATGESRFLKASGAETRGADRRSQSTHFLGTQDYLEPRPSKDSHVDVSLALKERAMLVPAPQQRRGMVLDWESHLEQHRPALMSMTSAGWLPMALIRQFPAMECLKSRHGGCVDGGHAIPFGKSSPRKFDSERVFPWCASSHGASGVLIA